MIRLTVVGEQCRAALVTSSPYFRITGGAIWVHPSDDVLPLVRYVTPGWQYKGAMWAGVRLEGPCRLVLGLARDPAGISDRLDALSIYGCVLSAQGIPFAVFDPQRDMWRGALAETWWHAFRIESVGIRPVLPDGTQRLTLSPPSQLPDPLEDTH